MHRFVNKVYDVTENYPRNEIFGLTSQFRSASLSVILNYIEGFARKSPKVMENFYEISYGSLKEAKYLVYFSFGRKYINKQNYEELMKLADEIGAMLWTIISKM